MLVTRFDQVFTIPVQARATRLRSRTVDELEFSDFGRFSYQSVGWALLALLGFWAGVGLLIFAAL
jgi:hypothetical protein